MKRPEPPTVPTALPGVPRIDVHHARRAGDPIEAMHASIPHGYMCADCTMDGVPCPFCYIAWWRRRFPHTTLIAALRRALTHEVDDG